MTCALSKRVRLVKAADFSAIFSQQRRVHATHFLLLAKPNELVHPRFGLAVAKKHLRTAIKRNLIKRLARESFRMLQQELPKLDMVLLTKKQLTDDWSTLTRQQIRLELDQLFKKLKRNDK